MRKRYRVLLLAAIVAALIVPVGFALSLESTPLAARTRSTEAVAASTTTATMLPLVRTQAPTVADLIKPVPDGAKLFFVGTFLFGLAAVLRRAPQK